MAQYFETRRSSPTRWCSSAWATSTSCSSRTPVGAAAGARHHADQARPARRRGHPDVRRAGARRRGLSRQLIRAGFKVAVCEQMEDPAEARKRGAKSVVRRDVVRVVTARHADRGRPARRPRRTTTCCAGVAGRGGSRPGLGRALHRRGRSQATARAASAGDARPPGPARDPGPRAPVARPACATLAVEAGGCRQPLPARRLTADRRRAPAEASSTASTPSTASARFDRAELAAARRDRRLPGAHPEAGAAAPRARRAGERRRHADRPGHPRAAWRSTAAPAGGREGSLLAAIDRTRDRRRRAPAGRAPGRPADRRRPRSTPAWTPSPCSARAPRAARRRLRDAAAPVPRHGARALAPGARPRRPARPRWRCATAWSAAERLVATVLGRRCRALEPPRRDARLEALDDLVGEPARAAALGRRAAAPRPRRRLRRRRASARARRAARAARRQPPA